MTIKCFSNVSGHKNAQEIVIDLNAMKSEKSDPFYIDYSVSDMGDDLYVIVGNVTKNDWDELDLGSDFMETTIL
jgi:fructose 1,6-bisphosphatase